MSTSVDEAAVLSALSRVNDPDLNQDIVSLGFVREVVIDGGRVGFEVRLTTPACPAKEDLRRQCLEMVGAVPGVRDVHVRMTASTRGGLGSGAGDALAGVRNVLVVASGKGGVGKSSTAVHLARALADAGARVGLLDADIHGPSIQQMTGAGVPTESAGERMLPPEQDGIAVLSMAMFVTGKRPALLRGPRVTAVVRQFLTAFDWGERDYLIIDTPPGTGDVHITLAQLVPITGVVLVTTPQEVALADTRRALSMFQTMDVPVLGVIETMSGFVCPSCDAVHPLFGAGGGARLAAEAGVPLLGAVPVDMALMAGAERSHTVFDEAPNGPAARAYREAAGAVAARVSTLHLTGGDALESFSLAWVPRG